MKALDVKRGMIVQHPTRNYCCLLTVARIRPNFKSSLIISFIGGEIAHVGVYEDIYVFKDISE